MEARHQEEQHREEWHPEDRHQDEPRRQVRPPVPAAGIAGADPYVELTREEAVDRRRLRWAAVAAAAAHLLLLLPLPLPRTGGGPGQGPGAPPALTFRLREVRFAPPPLAATVTEVETAEPEPAADPAIAESGSADEVGGSPPEPSVEILVPRTATGSLLPPQPLSAPRPAYPESLWRAGIQGEVLLTVLVDGEGQVLEVTVEEGPEALGELAAQATRRWLFLPASLDGTPLTTAVRVRVRFPGKAGEAGDGAPAAAAPDLSPPVQR